MPVLHAEALRDHAQRLEAQTLIEMPGMDIAFHHGVELHEPEALFPGLFKGILHKHLPDMLSPAVLRYCIAGICYMSTASHIVGMKYVKPYYFALILRYRRMALSRKKLVSHVHRQQLLLGKCFSILYDLIPYGHHGLKVVLPVSSDYHPV